VCNSLKTRSHYVTVSMVGHSERMNKKPLESWIICTDDGETVTDHCTCMVGVGECCIHVGATLFFYGAKWRVSGDTTCTEKENLCAVPAFKG